MVPTKYGIDHMKSVALESLLRFLSEFWSQTLRAAWPSLRLFKVRAKRRLRIRAGWRPLYIARVHEAISSSLGMGPKEKKLSGQKERTLWWSLLFTRQ